MFGQPQSNQHGNYSGITQRPINYSQNLWKVNDTELHKPGERFIAEGSAYLDAIIEQSIAGPLESAPIPKGLRLFVEDLVKTFGAVPSKFSSVNEVIFRVMRWLDFDEFYYLLFGSAVQQNCNQLKFTYRLKESGQVLEPNKLECFGVSRSYRFEHFEGCQKFLENPSIRAALDGVTVLHQTKRSPITKEDMLEKLSEILYGDYACLSSDIEEWIFTYYSSLEYDRKLTDEDILQMDSNRRMDQFFWTVGTLAALMWFKSPFALRFLAEYHPVYMKLLRWDEARKEIVVIPESGGEAVVDGWNIYTRESLLVQESSPPGTCECCKETLHCTKYVNAQALFEPVCSCGGIVEVENTEFMGHGYNHKSCKPYLDKHPPFNAFVCQRCINVAIQRLDPKTTKCQRTSCPATHCVHHAGSRFYAAELTRRRTLLLGSR